MNRLTAAILALCALTAWPGPSDAQDALPVQAADTNVGRALEAPVNTLPVEEKFWWSDEWYDRGVLEVPTNHAVVERALTYENPEDGTEVPVIFVTCW